MATLRDISVTLFCCKDIFSFIQYTGKFVVNKKKITK